MSVYEIHNDWFPIVDLDQRIDTEKPYSIRIAVFYQYYPSYAFLTTKE